MSEPTRRPTMEQIIGNMTTSMHNSEGQYIQLGITPPPSPSEQVAWSPPAHSYLHHEIPPNLYQQLPQYNPSFNYVQSNRYLPDTYEKHLYQNPQPNNNANLYHQFFIAQPEIPLQQQQTRNYHDNLGTTSSLNPTHILENVVGNWVPNTSGTYSPFGNNTPPRIANIFEPQPDVHFDDSKTDDFCNFTFNRDNKKPRIVAEVKPMRPSYSDVLTKPVVNVPVKKKIDVKDVTKQKKEGKKLVKNEKGGTKTIHRLNSDVKIDKAAAAANKTNEKSSKSDGCDLNRRWSSLDNMHTSGDSNCKKVDEMSPMNKNNKAQAKQGKKQVEPECSEEIEDDFDCKNESTLNITKAVRKGGKNNSKQKGGDEKVPSAKRVQRNRKRDKQVTLGVVGQKIKQYVPGWWKLLVSFGLWLVNLVSDICRLSVHLSRDIGSNLWNTLLTQWEILVTTLTAILGHLTFLTWIWNKIKKKPENSESARIPMQYSELETNIAMPSTGDEAMKRLLACKGKNPYSILGVTPTCTDDDIKRYYKRQAFLVHPDKNQQPGAEEAFKILVHAFDMIGEPERRARYDRGVAESAQVEQAWSKLSELLAQLQKKVEAAANTIRCSACGLRHKRVKIDRPSYAARNCATCKIHHSAREGDIWAEAKCLGFLWHYYACMDGGIYDITEWAGCQKESLQHLKPNSHNVQYRIALGKQNGQQARHGAAPCNKRPSNLETLMNSIYGDKDAYQNYKRKNKKSK